MQKSTLFTLLLFIIVSLSVADLLVNKETLKTNIVAESLKTTASKPAPATSSEPAPSPAVTSPASTSPAPAPAPSVSDFLENRRFLLEKIKPQDLQTIGFQNMKLESAPFDQMIFQLLDVSTSRSLSVMRMHLTDSKNVFGVLHEFEFPDEAQTVALYADLKQKIGAFSPNASLNETNQYGDNSFFMNDKTRSGTAFLVFRLKNHLFAFSYPKASHEFFKSLILLLAKVK